MMKVTSLALAASFIMSSYAHGQPPTQTPAPSSTTATTLSAPSSRECKKEVKGLCGRRPKSELQSCLKDGLDLNKFSDSCKAEITQPAKSGS
jgi:hypothetical protein